MLASDPMVPRYYVSYAWADESDPTRERKIDELCAAAGKLGFEIKRDKTTLRPGDLISDFMRQIGEGDEVFIFLGKKYLHSPFCMFELFEMWRNSKQNREEFLRRVRFFTLGDAKIGTPVEWLEYAKFWKQQREDLGKAIDGVGWQDAGEESIKRFRLMDEFAGKVADVLALFADVVQARTFEDFLKYGFEDPPHGGEAPVEKERPEGEAVEAAREELQKLEAAETTKGTEVVAQTANKADEERMLADVSVAATGTKKAATVQLTAFQDEIRVVQALRRDERMARAKQLVEQYWTPPFTTPTALALLRMLKNSANSSVDFTWISDFIATLPPEVAVLEEVVEYNALALASCGRNIEAIAKIEALIARSGPTWERLGLLGGRYKRLFLNAETPDEKLIYLNRSIDAYERGLELDLNEYYNSSNLPRLYRQRKRKGDEERARSVLKLIIAACQRAKKLGTADEWLRPTLLGAAFDDGDPDLAEELVAEVAAEGSASWKLDFILEDLKTSVTQIEDKDRKERLTTILDALAQARGV